MSASSWTYRILGVQPDERSRVGLLTLLNGTNGLFIALFYSSGYALFLDEFGSVRFLPAVYVSSAVLGWLLITWLQQQQQARSGTRLFVQTLILNLLVVGSFWLALGGLGQPESGPRLGARILVFVLLALVEPLIALLSITYQGLVNPLFDLRQGKRLYGLLGTGAVFASMVGYYLIPILKVWMDLETVDILGLSLAGLGGSVVLAGEVARRFPVVVDARRADHRPKAPKLKEHVYFRRLASIMALFTVAYFLLDYAFMGLIRGSPPAGLDVVGFLGLFFGSVKVAELAFRVLVSGRLVRRLGVLGAQLALPAVVLACLLVASVAWLAEAAGLGWGTGAFFSMVVAAKFAWHTLKKAIFDPSFVVFYQPLPEDERLALQTGVDGFAVQASTFVAGALLLLLLMAGVGVSWVVLLILPLMVAWIGAAVRANGAYGQELERALARSPARAVGHHPVEDLHTLTGRVRGPGTRMAFGLLSLVDPVGGRAGLGRSLASPDPWVRTAALDQILHCDVAELEAELGARTGEATEEELNAAERAATSLSAARTVASSPEEVAAAARSPDREKRALAARAMARNGHVYRELEALLWDLEPEVRRWALLAAARDPRDHVRLRVVDHLEDPVLGETAFRALALAGPSVGPLLVEAYGGATSRDTRLKLMRLIADLDGPRSRAFLVEQLEAPDTVVQRRALDYLCARGRAAEGDERRHLKELVRRTVNEAAQETSALADLADEDDSGLVRSALYVELKESKAAALGFASLLYDPEAVATAHAALEGQQQSAAYALEVLDLRLLDSELKGWIFPLLEPATPRQRIKNLSTTFKVHRLGYAGRLGDMVYRGGGHLVEWTRATAFEALMHQATEIGDEAVASLYHPDPLFRELGAWTLYKRAPRVFRRCMGDLEPVERARLEKLFEEEPRPDARDDVPVALPPGTLFARVQTLWRCDGLRALGGDGALALARCLEAITPGTGTRGHESGQDPQSWRDESFYLVVHPVEEDAHRNRPPRFTARMQRRPPDPGDTAAAFRLAPSSIAGLVQAFPETAVFLLESLAQGEEAAPPVLARTVLKRPPQVGLA